MEKREKIIKDIQGIFKALITIVFLLSIGLSRTPENRKMIYSALKILIPAHIIFTLTVLWIRRKDKKEFTDKDE